MHVLPSSDLTGAYALETLPALDFAPVTRAQAGRVHIASGYRSPAEGMRTSSSHEIGYVVRGSLRVESAQETRIIKAGDMLAMTPAVPHATTALEDSEIFFVLLAPHPAR